MIAARPAQWPLWVHVAGVACVLVVASLFVGHRAYVFLDEAALLAQVEVVQDGGWTVERPFAEVDPEERLVPMARSTVVDDRFAPFPNHPLHVLLASVADRLAGRAGIALLSVLGVVGASAAAGVLASAAGRAQGAVAVWVTGLLSPLVFDANLVVAHGVAAALTGALFLVVFRWAGPASVPRLGLASALAFALGLAGALLRSEVILLCGVIALVAGARGVVERQARRVLPGAAAGLGGLTAYLLEPRWIEHLVGTSAGRKVIAESSRGGASGATDGAWKVLLEPGDPAAVPLVIAVLLAVVSVLLLRARPSEPALAAVTSAAAVVAAIVHLGDPLIVAGLLWAFPVLAVGVVAGAGRSMVVPTEVRWSAVTAIAFGVAVLATQYRVGGGVEWGWRYFAVALPAVCAALSIPLVHLWRDRPAGPGRIALVGILVVCALVPASGLLAQRRIVNRTDGFLTALDEAIADADASLVLAADSSLGRFAWDRSIAGEVVTIGRDGSGLAAIEDVLPESMLLVYVGEPPPLPDGLEVAGPPTILLAGAYASVPVRAT